MSTAAPTALIAPPPGRYQAVHQKPSGPGDARPTALQVLQDEGYGDPASLQGKVFLVTGGSAGLGAETARVLHHAGASVFLPVRDRVKGEGVVQSILASSPGKGQLEVLELDLESLQSVRECAAEFLRKSSQLNVLILNAGIMACPQGATKDGFERQFGVNHLAHFLLFQLLKPTLLASSSAAFRSRVVSLSSFGHTMGTVRLDDPHFHKGDYNHWLSYAQSKTANIWSSLEIERRYASQGLHALSVHPGGIDTGLARHMSEEEKKMYGSPELRLLFKSVPQGAATTVFAAISKELEGRGGLYLEDCSIASPLGTKSPMHGHAAHAYDFEGAKKLWQLSNQQVGLAAEE